MRTFLLSIFAVAMTLAASAQTQVATFDTISISQADTYLISYDYPGQDIGFNAGWTHFPCVYDTLFGGIWDHGFAYSNMTDSVTGGYTNQYSAKTGIGYDSSSTYAVAWCSLYGSAPARITFPTYIPDTVKGFYITNSTYAYNLMRDGDPNPNYGKKFGGVTGNDPDWFLLTIKAYHNGTLKPDSVDFYLADFRDANNANDYIVNNWRWVDLTSLAPLDSLEFIMNSSDTNQGGVITPTYFCMDNFTTVIDPINVKHVNASAFVAKIYPNPATDNLYIDLNDNSVKTIDILDATGKLVMNIPVNEKNIKINTATLQSGLYFLQLKGDKQTASTRFVKQ